MKNSVVLTPTAIEPADRAAAIRELAHDHYAVPSAAAALIEAAASPVRSEERLRAQAALRALAYDTDAPDLLDSIPSPLHGPALAVGVTLLSIVATASTRERQRIAGLLVALCREAQRIGRSA